jgi:hypothetical protein
LEISLVDADSGKLVATVAAVPGTDVQVAGRSYKMLPGSKSGERKVRGTQTPASSPKYHATRLPLAADLGFAVAAYLGYERSVLPVVQVASDIVIMTWLGKLHNVAMSLALELSGFLVTAGAFGLVVEGRTSGDALDIVKRAVDSILQNNPLGKVPVERMVDVGPHFQELTPKLQRIARTEWLDAQFMKEWADGLARIEQVPSESELGGDLIKLC